MADPAAAAPAAAAFAPLPPRVKPEVDPISERKQALVEAFYQGAWLPTSRTHPHWPKSWRELSESDQRDECHKLMVARKFEHDAAAAMMHHIIMQRHSQKLEERLYFPPPIRVHGFDMDALAAFYKQPAPCPATEEYHKIYSHLKDCYAPCFAGTSKWGHPVYIECYGRMSPTLLIPKARQITAIGTPPSDTLSRYHTIVNETAVRLTRFQDATFAKPRGERVLGTVVVIDVEGLSMSHLSSELLGCIQAIFSVDKMSYPEFISKVLVVNAGVIIRLAYSMVSAFLDARTAAKISFLAPGEATLTGLREWIDDSNIPVLYGGKLDVGLPYVLSQAEHDRQVAELGAAGAADKSLAELGVPVAAGAAMTREYAVGAQDVVSFEFQSDYANTIDFSAHFVPAHDPASPTTIHAASRVTKHSASFSSPTTGVVRLHFDNTFSWWTAKHITLRCITVPKPEALVIAGEGAAPSAAAQ
jgi:hypothetical protein